jgi:hypothetical protein
MGSYTAAQYAEQRRVSRLANEANALGVCVVCGQPQGVWPSGVRRITCGADWCYRRWLNFRPVRGQGSEKGDDDDGE